MHRGRQRLGKGFLEEGHKGFQGSIVQYYLSFRLQDGEVEQVQTVIFGVSVIRNLFLVLTAAVTKHFMSEQLSPRSQWFLYV